MLADVFVPSRNADRMQPAQLALPFASRGLTQSTQTRCGQHDNWSTDPSDGSSPFLPPRRPHHPAQIAARKAAKEVLPSAPFRELLPNFRGPLRLAEVHAWCAVQAKKTTAMSPMERAAFQKYQSQKEELRFPGGVTGATGGGRMDQPVHTAAELQEQQARHSGVGLHGTPGMLPANANAFHTSMFRAAMGRHSDPSFRAGV